MDIQWCSTIAAFNTKKLRNTNRTFMQKSRFATRDFYEIQGEQIPQFRSMSQ